MSSENELPIVDSLLEDMTSDLRVDDLKAIQGQVPSVSVPPVAVPLSVKSFVKPIIKLKGLDTSGLTPEQVIGMSKIVEQVTRETINNSKFDPSLGGQAVRKSAVPITDFSKLTLDDVYDLSVPIEAKAFMSADVLAIKLKDTNYEARWVNKNPQRLGEMIAKGFTYIEPNDLVSSNAIQTGVDAEGHYCFNDVVAMKIDKATYYRALRAAHERAVSTTDQSKSRERAAKTADAFMYKESGFSADYNGASTSGKMKFYDPGIQA